MLDEKWILVLQLVFRFSYRLLILAWTTTDSSILMLLLNYGRWSYRSYHSFYHIRSLTCESRFTLLILISVNAPLKCILPIWSHLLNPCCFRQVHVRILFNNLFRTIRLTNLNFCHVPSSSSLMDKFTRICNHKFKKLLFLGFIELWKYKIMCILDLICIKIVNVNCRWLLLLHQMLILIWMIIPLTCALKCILASNTSLAQTTSRCHWLHSRFAVVILLTLLLLIISYIVISHLRYSSVKLLLLLAWYILSKMINLGFHLHFFLFFLNKFYFFNFIFII